MKKWGAEIISDVPVPGAEIGGRVTLPEDNGPLTKAMADAFAEVEKWDLLVDRCVVKLDGPIVTITAHPDEQHLYDMNGNPIVGHTEGVKCYECDVMYFGKHPYNGCPLSVVQEVMET